MDRVEFRYRCNTKSLQIFMSKVKTSIAWTFQFHSNENEQFQSFLSLGMDKDYLAVEGCNKVKLCYSMGNTAL